MSDRSRTLGGVPASKSVVAPHPTYVAELVKRIRSGPGMPAVADRAGMSRMTVWKLVNKTVSAAIVARAREALAELDPKAEPMPPVAVSIVDAEDFAWIMRGRALRAADPKAYAKALAGLPTPPDTKRRRK